MSNNNTVTAEHQTAACRYFIALSEIEETEMAKYARESAPWQIHRDRFVSLSNTAAQLMGEKSANPFI